MAQAAASGEAKAERFAAARVPTEDIAAFVQYLEISLAVIRLLWYLIECRVSLCLYFRGVLVVLYFHLMPPY